MKFVTINPSTEEVIKEYTELEKSEIEKIIENAHKRFNEWRKVPFSKRAELMLKASEILLQKKHIFAQLMAEEMGKPLSQGVAEAEKCAWCCKYYAENAEEQLKDLYIQTEFRKSYVSFQPLGVILAIMPWNFPFWQVFRFAAPNLMAGNVGLLKHSRNTMGCGEAIEQIFLEAGFPEFVFKNLVIGSEPVADIIKHKHISAITLTGSTPVGSKVAELAGKYIKKTVMELGGSDPYIILKDAELEKTVEICVNARLINSGQSCIAAKRFIVEKEISKDFEELFAQKMKEKTFGNPLEGNYDIGPMAREDLREEIHLQVQKSIEQGAKLLTGGFVPQQKGYFYPPTVLTNVQKNMLAYSEEIFGPVASIIYANDENHAIELANDTSFGLGSAIFTKDVEKGEKIAKYELQAGSCFVNDFVRSDPRLPFGGVKESGYGRELSEFGIREFVNIKTCCIR